MNGRFADVMFQARQCAGYTRERAAEMLNISPRTLTYYEAGRQVPDRIVAMMVDAYASLRELAAACMGMEILGTKKSALAGTKADFTRKTF